MTYILIYIQSNHVLSYILIHVHLPYMFNHMPILACCTYIYSLHIVNVHTLTHKYTHFKVMDELDFWDHVVLSSGNWYLICKTKPYVL